MNQQNHGGRRSGSDFFDTFWNNVGANGLSGLRLSLFGVASTNPTQQQVGIAKDSFMSWVNNFDVRLYSFINIK